MRVRWRADLRTRAIPVVLLLLGTNCASGTIEAGEPVATTVRTAETSTTTSPATSSTPPEPAPSAAGSRSSDVPAQLTWDPCGEGIECAWLTVPVDHAAPEGATIELRVARRPAHDPSARLGVLVVNPGGPGASGVGFLRAGFTLGPEVERRFDLVSWDPRGVGESAPVTCADGALRAWLGSDPDPDGPGELEALRARAAELAAACDAPADLLPHIGTEDTVDDLDLLRRALREDQLNYLGLSYGTRVGLGYLAEHPRHLRAVALDGVVDPTADVADLAEGQAVGFESALERAFAACSSDEGCPVRDPASAYATIARRVEEAPLETPRGPVGPAELQLAVGAATYAPELTESFLEGLRRALEGDASGLRGLADRYLGAVGYGSYLAVMCRDLPHPDVQGFSDLATRLERRAPTFGAALGHELLPCASWPAPAGPVLDPVRGTTGPPVLVIGTTGDAATPFDQAVEVSDQLADARLLTHAGEGHTALGRDDCVRQATVGYLVRLELPAPGAVC